MSQPPAARPSISDERYRLVMERLLAILQHREPVRADAYETLRQDLAAIPDELPAAERFLCREAAFLCREAALHRYEGLRFRSEGP